MKRVYITVGFSLFVILVVIGGVINANLEKTREKTAIEIQREANKIKFSATWGAVWPAGSLLLAAIVLSLATLAGVALVRMLWNRSKAVFPDDNGIMPVIVSGAWTWITRGRFTLPAQVKIFHDPNRATGSTTIYSPAMDGPAMNVDRALPKPGAIAPEILTITQGGQIIQASRAAASGDPMPQTQGHASRAGPGRIKRLGEGTIYSQPLPAVEVIDPGHISRLLEVQGQLPVNARRPGNGQTTV